MSRGLPQVLENIVGPESMLQDILKGKVSLKDLFAPITSQTGEYLKSIYEKVHRTKYTIQY